ncbi:MAG: type II toxin-antitoxin system VapC family toxin [Ahrensia sp.]|nr:type II toxin-antitoxin system VapC family toxin [Ahrensia sp.]
MIVDASAILSVVLLEDDAEHMSQQFKKHVGELRISVVNQWEVWARIERSDDSLDHKALARFESNVSIQYIEVDLQQTHLAREAWAQYGKGSGHKAQLNFGDCFAYALSKALDEPLLFKGKDFIQTDVRSAL